MAALRPDDQTLPMTDGSGRPEDWLTMASTCHRQSTNAFDQGARAEWSKAMAHWRGEHAPDSMYHLPEFKNRSRLFRPMTKSLTLTFEASAAASFFTTADLVEITAADESDPQRVAGALLMREIINHRLSETIPWFLTVMGGIQCARLVGVVASKQYWAYEEKVEAAHEPIVGPDGAPMVDAGGRPLVRKVENVEVVEDEPRIDLIQPDRLHVRPTDWRKPVESSPFVIYEQQMTVGEVRERMKAIDRKTGQPQWRQAAETALRAAAVTEERRRDSPVAPRPDSFSSADAKPLPDHDLVWVWEVILRKDGTDWHYYTLKDQALLTEPRPLEEVYIHGQRPFVIGYGSLEVFTHLPQGKAVQMSPLQEAFNHITNQRLDNARLATNGMWFIRDGSGINTAQLMRSTPGAVLSTKDPTTDIINIRPGDVPQSAYLEQDRLKVEVDELAGAFSGSSVQTNRKLNETVGGMNLLASSASSVAEYEMRIFTETWVEPVLRQLVKLEQAYETDLTVLGLAGQKAELWQRYGVDPTEDDLMREGLTVRCAVGISAADPQRRMQRIMGAFASWNQIMQPLMQAHGAAVLKSPAAEAIANEVFGAAGFRDPALFLNVGDGPDPQTQQAMEQLQQQVEELSRKLEDKQADRDADMQEAQLKADTSVLVERIRQQAAMARNAVPQIMPPVEGF